MDISPVKVAVLLPSMEMGGAERLVLQELGVLRHDKRFSFEIHLVFAKGPLYEECLSLGIPVRTWHAKHRSFRMLWTYMRIASHLRRRRVMVLHCHLLYKHGPWVGVLARVNKIVTTIHTKSQMNPLDRLGCQISHVVLACGPQVAEHLKTFLPPSRIKTIHNAITAPRRDARLKDAAEKEYGIEQDDKLIVSIGRLIFDKGYDILLEAFQNISKACPEARLLIAGEGPERQRLEQQIRELSLQTRVRLLGIVRDVTSLYERADIYVNSSRREGLPLTLLEASGYQKPIVATDTGGNRDIVIDGVTGLLVPQEDTGALARALLNLLNDQNRCVRFAEQSYANIRKNYDMKEHCEQLASVYLS